MLDNLPLLQPEAMNVFDREFSAIGSKRRAMQRRNHWKVAQMSARHSHFAHDRVALSNERVDLKQQIRKGPAPYPDDVLNEATAENFRIADYSFESFGTRFTRAFFPGFLQRLR